MKKGLIFLLGIVSFFGINKVSAAEIYLEYETNVNLVKPFIDELGNDTINNAISKNIEYYNNYLISEYPYYFISLHTTVYGSGEKEFYVVLTALESINSDNFSAYFNQSFDTNYHLLNSSYNNYEQIYYDFTSENVLAVNGKAGLSNLYLFTFSSNYDYYNVYDYYYSNFDLYYKGSLLNSNTNLTHLNFNDTLYIPKLDDSSSYIIHDANEDILIEPYYLFDTNTDSSLHNYTTINLNDYSYVILSLKNYTPRDTFTSTMYVKGQLCSTTVYNYGLEEKKDYVSGYQTQPCSYYYNNFTRFASYIKSEDISNHAIYYLTSYDSSKPNLVKVDSSVYDITYITSENEKEPYVSIEGKNYPVLPYSELTDTAELTEKNGIDNTWTCAKYDTNCILNSSGIDIDNLFSQPLETLKTVWETIKTIFSLITEFILLLPQTLQAFLYLAFAVGIALGIIKIIF